MSRPACWLQDRARQLFERLDSQRQGFLDYDGVADFFRALSPRISADDLRYLLAQVHVYDVDGVGQVRGRTDSRAAINSGGQRCLPC